MYKKVITCLLAVCLLGSLLTGCGQSGTEAPSQSSGANGSGEAEQQESKQEEAEKEFTVGSLTLTLPEGFAESEADGEDSGMGTRYLLVKDNIYLWCMFFGEEDYEKAGVPMPESVEEYAQRDNVKKSIPEGMEFAKNKYDTLCAEYTYDNEEEGISYKCFQALLKGPDGMWTISLNCPEKEYDGEKVAKWISTAAFQ